MKIIFPIILFFSIFVGVSSCSEEPKEVTKKTNLSLTEVKDGVFTEYYPGRKAVKIQGPQNAKGERSGRWFFYAENGNEQSMTEFLDGKKNGFIFVRYPSGRMRYTGEYINDVASGTWKFYREDGTVEQEKVYNTTN